MDKRGGARSRPAAAPPWASPSPLRSLGHELGAAAATDPREKEAERGGSGGRPRRLGSGSSSRPLPLVPLSPARQGMGRRSSGAASSSTRHPPYPHPVLRRCELRPVVEVVRHDGLGEGASSTSSSSSELPRPPAGCAISLPLSGLRTSAGGQRWLGEAAAGGRWSPRKCAVAHPRSTPGMASLSPCATLPSRLALPGAGENTLNAYCSSRPVRHTAPSATSLTR
jgi:hypothetical protein